VSAAVTGPAILTIFVSALFAVLGGLLVFSPPLFLRVHDFLNPGSRNLKAEWRSQIGRLEYKVLGMVLLCFGLFMFFNTIAKLR
jgi:hypothetical protein